MGSKNELEHLFLNLIGNARDAYENRTLSNKEIRIDAHRQNGDVILTVSDNAGGIPEDIQERIFDPYFTTKSDGKGTGIGLYMTKMIVERNFGGTIAAANRAGGAVFTITFRSEP
jgi:signal transduction histidine kinase